MPTLVIIKDPIQASAKRELRALARGITLMDALERNFAPGFGGIETDVYLNGVKIAHDSTEAHAKALDDSDVLLVAHRPSGVELAIAAVIAVVAAVAVVALTPTPTVPNDQGESNDSPNNSLSGQTNLARPYQAIPEIFGSIVSYPDLIQPALYEYVNDVKKVNEVFCIGVGQYDIGDVRSEASIIQKISGSSFTIYEPGTYPDDLMIAEATSEVDNQELEPKIDSTAEMEDLRVIFKPAGVDFDGNPDASTEASIAIVDIDAEADLYISLVSSVTFSNTTSNNGSRSFTDYETALVDSADAVVLTGVSVSTYEDATGVTAETLPPEGLIWVGWFQLPTLCDEIWCHFQFPQGLRTQDGKTWFRDWQIQIQETDSDGNETGSIIEYDYTRSARTLDPLFQTVKIDDITQGYYRIRAAMTSVDGENIDQDQLKWEAAQSIRYYDGARFGDVTLLEINTKATEYASAQSSREINADVTRKLPTWTEAGGYDGTLTASERFADAILYTLHVVGKVPLESIDLEGLYEIQEDLDARNTELGEFNYSFDDEGISLGDRISTICNCVRVLPYREGQVWKFVREEAKETAVAVFNRRNIASGENQSQMYQFRQPDEYDGVIVSYTDPDDNSVYEVYRKCNANGTITDSEDIENPNEFELTGCRSELQAIDRAELEARRILYQRITVTDTVLTDGFYVNIGDRVRWVDIYDTAVSDGEIIGQDGDIYETSEEIDWDGTEDHYVIVTDADGYPSEPTLVTQIDSTHFQATLSSITLANWEEIQVGSRYVLGTADDTSATDFVVKSKTPQSTGLVELELINYDERLFEEDA